MIEPSQFFCLLSKMIRKKKWLRKAESTYPVDCFCAVMG